MINSIKGGRLLVIIVESVLVRTFLKISKKGLVKQNSAYLSEIPPTSYVYLLFIYNFVCDNNRGVLKIVFKRHLTILDIYESDLVQLDTSAKIKLSCNLLINSL